MSSRPRTIHVFALLIAVYLLLLLPGAFNAGYFESPAGWLVLAPYLSVSLFHKLGVPGMLEHDGACGWGWCSPTPWGWTFALLAWLSAGWCVAWIIARLLARMSRRDMASTNGTQ